MIDRNNCKNRRIDLQTFYAYFLALASLFPNDGKWLYAKALVPALFLLLRFIKSGTRFTLEFRSALFIIAWFMLLLGSQLVMFDTHTTVNVSAFQKEVMRVLLYSLLILIVQGFSVSFTTVKRIVTMLLVVHLSIQLLQLAKFEMITVFLRTFYLSDNTPLSHFGLSQLEFASGFRSGSVFINPNVYLPYPLFFLVVFLQAIVISATTKQRILNSFLALLSILSLVLCGSRTGFFGLFFITSAFIAYKHRRRIAKTLIYITGVLLVFVFLAAILELRFFRVAEAFGDSFSSKLDGFADYLRSLNAISVLVGNNTSLGGTWMLDFEWAHIFAYYGLLGIVLYLSLYLGLAKHIFTYANEGLKRLNFIYIGLLLVLSIMGVSATLFLNMPAFYFFSLMLFSKEIVV